MTRKWVLHENQVWLIGLCIVGLFFFWRILSLNIGQFYADRSADELATTDIAIAWSPQHPDLLYQLARSESANSKRAVELLKKAVDANTANAAALMTLAKIWFSQGSIKSSEIALTLALRLRPHDTALRMAAAQYWLLRERWDLVLENWRIALETKQKLAAELYPVLLALAENRTTVSLLEPLLAKNPTWWPLFFRYVAENAIQTKTVKGLFILRRKSGADVTLVERKFYFQRLMKDRQWAEAYIAWLNSLPADRIQGAGLLFNGGFEYPLSNAGFDWHSIKLDGALVETAPTYGIGGERALHLVFKDNAANFKHLFQPLLLSPGAYRISGNVRLDSFRAQKGVRWQLNCENANKTLLGESELFLGLDQWRAFNFDVEVPEKECPAQRLRLVLQGQKRKSSALQGEVWFDDMSISRVKGSAKIQEK